MKSIMGACARRYHTTILFSSQNPDELDRIATATHRVQRIEGNTRSLNDELRDIAYEQIPELDYSQNYEWKLPNKGTVNPADLQNLIKEAGLYNEIPPVGKDLTMNDMLELRTKLVKTVPLIIKSRILNFNRPHTITTNPTKYYVNMKDGTTKEYQGYEHIINFVKAEDSSMFRNETEMNAYNKLLENTPDDTMKNSYFTTTKDAEIPIYTAWAQFRNGNNLLPPFYFSYVRTHKDGYPDNPETFVKPEVTNILLKITDEIFNENKEKYKTDIPEAKFKMCDINSSPYSFRSILVPKRYDKSGEVISYALKKDVLSDDYLQLLNLALRCNVIPEDPDAKDIKNITNEFSQDEKPYNVTIIGNSKEDAEKYFTVNNFLVKGIQWCKNNPAKVLNELLYVTEADNDTREVKLGDNPTEEEISDAINKIKENLIKITTNDMKKFDYIKYYSQHHNSSPEYATTHFIGMPALVLIASNAILKEFIDEKEHTVEEIRSKDLELLADYQIDTGSKLDERTLLDIAMQLDNYFLLNTSSRLLNVYIPEESVWSCYSGYDKTLSRNYLLKKE